MKHASDDDLRMIEGLIKGHDGTVTLQAMLAAALVDEVRKHRQRQTTLQRTKDAGTFEVGTIISSRTGEPMIDLALHGHALQLELPKAREIRSMLDGAIEAAVSDALLYRFLHDKIGLSEDAAGRALLDFRELRQGSRRTVYPT